MSHRKGKPKALFTLQSFGALNVAIEYQGEQHYRPTGFVYSEERFVHQQERDNAVRCYCNEHNIKLIEIPYTEFDNIEDILTKELGHL